MVNASRLQPHARRASSNEPQAGRVAPPRCAPHGVVEWQPGVLAIAGQAASKALCSGSQWLKLLTSPAVHYAGDAILAEGLAQGNPVGIVFYGVRLSNASERAHSVDTRLAVYVPVWRIHWGLGSRQTLPGRY